MEVPSVCSKCQTAIGTVARYCPQCGWELSRPYARINFSLKGGILVIAVTLVLWSAAWFLQSRAGVKPTEAYRPDDSQAANNPHNLNTATPVSDPELDKLRAAVSASPADINALRTLAVTLLDRMRNSDSPAQSIVLEATDVMGQILRSDPKDRDALIALADISFNQKVFDKAVSLYERYLVLEPTDLSARSRYASSLAFMGKSKEAVTELEKVLSIEPNNFHALAYLSITYAQMGNTEQALEIGAKALKNSPSSEASDRFNEFLKALAAQKKAAPTSSVTTKSSGSGTTADLADFVAKNPVAGPKYVRFEERSAEELALFFRHFPMEAMPPMAKDKFYSGIKAKIQELQLKKLKRIVFLDADTAKELDSLTIEQ